MSQKVRACLKHFAYLVSICCFALLITICYTPSVKADVIYHAFNMPFQEIKTKLPELKDIGYTYIQISPPEKSNPNSKWWARYQPLDYSIDSNLGSEKDLKELIDEAHRQGQKIIVDVVLNHMANYDDGQQDELYIKGLNYPPNFKSENFHPKEPITNWNNRYQVTHGWLDGDLPDLKTETPYVREVEKKYLLHLLDLGADGFRFDATKHIEPDFFKAVLQVLPDGKYCYKDKYCYGEVIGQNMYEYSQYTGIMDVTDYQLFHTILDAMSFGGDIRSLVNPQDSGRALPGTNAVTFARNHDTVNNEGRDKYGDKQDALLANAYVLAIEEGFPLIYRDDGEEELTKAGIKFHEAMLNEPQYFRNGNEIAAGADSLNLLFIERGPNGNAKGLAIINKSGDWFDVPVAQMPSLATGCYKDLHHNFSISVDNGGDGKKYINKWGSPNRGGIKIGPRDALFFVQTYSNDCKAIWN